MLTSNAFIALIDRLQVQFDGVVETGSDEELFISGYLNGHFSLVASQCINEQLFSTEKLNEKMQASLSTAFDSGELEPVDQQRVYAFWANLLDVNPA